MAKDLPMIIAHRGESHDAPENSLGAINLAWERGADAVEIDVHKTKDDHLVVIHDIDTLRVSGDKKVIKDSLLTDIKDIDIGSLKSDEWKDERIPTLKEVLDTVPPNKKLIVELKSYENIIPQLQKDILSTGLKPEQLEFISFNVYILQQIHEVFPKNNKLWLLELDYYWPWAIGNLSAKKLIEKLKSYNVNGANVWGGNLITSAFVEEIKKADFSLYIWTVNELERAKKFASYNVDAITTDRAQWLKQNLS